jgi:CRISPR system Cascade subunit CasD
LDGLTSLKMGVRVDREGSMERDFQTAGGGKLNGRRYGVARASGGLSDNAVTSTRYYIADADFLVALQSEDEDMLRNLEDALRDPVWPLYLGRKSFVPSAPILPPTPYSAIVPLPLRQALQEAAWVPRTAHERDARLRDIEERTTEGDTFRLRAVFDAPYGSTAEVRCDVPLSFAERRFTIRQVETAWIPLTPDMIKEESLCSSLA